MRTYCCSQLSAVFRFFHMMKLNSPVRERRVSHGHSRHRDCPAAAINCKSRKRKDEQFSDHENDEEFPLFKLRKRKTKYFMLRVKQNAFSFSHTFIPPMMSLFGPLQLHSVQSQPAWQHLLKRRQITLKNVLLVHKCK